QVKMNLAPDVEGLGLRIAPEGTVAWDPEPVRLSADRAMEEEKEARKLQKAMDWLQASLANGSQPANEIIQQGRECGISKWMLRSAKNLMGISVQKHGYNGDTHWRWSLPER
ncbi:MAG: hypothetical protein ACM3U2_06570, partial [Deltaproteobacteria bacterium]